MFSSFQTLQQSSVIPAYTLGPSDIGRFFFVDTTSSFGGFYLPSPATFGVGVWACQKIDGTSNFIQIFTQGQDVNGYIYYVLTIKGDSITLACDGLKWSVISRSSTNKRLFAEHRTIVASAGQSPYQSRITDRHALLRCNADSSDVTIVLPEKVSNPTGNLIFGMGHHTTPPPGYASTFSMAVLRTSASVAGKKVFLVTADGSNINGQTSYTLSNDFEMALLDFDSNAWFAHRLNA